jgi:hypothetical protein
MIRFEVNGGVVWNWTFYDNDQNEEAITFKDPTGGASGVSPSWTTGDTMGTADVNGKANTYVEDCTFNEMMLQAMDLDDNSRVVIRHCTFNNSGMSSHGLDTSPYGMRQWELYNNTFVFSTSGTSRAGNAFPFNLNWWFFCRGGTGVIFNNVMPDISTEEWGAKDSTLFTVYNIRRLSSYIPPQTTWQALHQIGQGYSGGLTLDPVYIWANTGGTRSNNPGISDYQPDEVGLGLLSANFIKQGRDYYVNTAKPGYAAYPYPHPLRAGSAPVPTPTPTPIPIPTSKPASAVGKDFNHDGTADLIWENPASGQRLIWFMINGAPTTSLRLPTVGTNWHIAAIGDFLGNGQSDLVWENTDGDHLIWIMNAGVPQYALNLLTVAGGWHIVGAGDFDNEGQADLVWENSDTGQCKIWLMSHGVPTTSIQLPSVSPNWHIAGVGDFLGNGQSDLVWENTLTGQRLIWLMNGATPTTAIHLGFIDPSWHIAGAGDFFGTGQAGLVWENTSSGQRLIWAFRNGQPTFSIALPTVPTSWHIVDH